MRLLPFLLVLIFPACGLMVPEPYVECVDEWRVVATFNPSNPHDAFRTDSIIPPHCITEAGDTIWRP